jgi:hypothetical protein
MARPRATTGDAQAVLQAFGGGGLAILPHNRVVEGAPSQGLADSRVGIRPCSDRDYLFPSTRPARAPAWRRARPTKLGRAAHTGSRDVCSAEMRSRSARSS